MGWDDTTHQTEDMPPVCAKGTVSYLPWHDIGCGIGHSTPDAAKDIALHMDRHGQAILLEFDC